MAVVLCDGCAVRRLCCVTVVLYGGCTFSGGRRLRGLCGGAGGLWAARRSPPAPAAPPRALQAPKVSVFTRQAPHPSARCSLCLIYYSVHACNRTRPNLVHVFNNS